MKIRAIAIICIAYLVLSIFICFPEHKNSDTEIQGMNSSELFLKIIEEDNFRIEKYVDADGNIVLAADKNYAMVIKHINEKGNVVSEFYFDEEDVPVSMPDGQYGILRKYDEKGHEVKQTFVDAEGRPMWIKSGYVSVLKEYDKNGNEVKDVYVDLNDNPVFGNNGYAGRVKEYDKEGQCIRIINLDILGDPVNSSAGIAVEERVLDEDGRVQTVMYFDVNRKPVANILGQYGETYAYDEHERKCRITYLDVEGNPAPNIYGYTILQKTFKANNSTETDMYFNADGKPMKLSHGEYGVRWDNGRQYYLTKTGKVNYFLSLDELLHANTLLAILIGAVLSVFGVCLPKPLQVVLLLLYAVFIIYMTLLYRTGGDPEGQFELFWSYKEFFSERSLRIELFQNVWLFVPLGAMLYYCTQKQWVLVVPLLFSIVIEAIQYFTGRGLFEFDDIISNGVGGCYGFWIGKLALEMRNRIMSLKKGLAHI